MQRLKNDSECPNDKGGRYKKEALKVSFLFEARTLAVRKKSTLL
ncbi:Uncharacterised protein [Acinetobacter nosocomialis]|nr:Uncharacterised protein [Acinetobacter nosocomialis]